LYGNVFTIEGIRAAHAEESHGVSQAEWVKVLEQVGWSRAVFVEVMFPDASAAPELKKSIELLESAQAARLRGCQRPPETAGI